MLREKLALWLIGSRNRTALDEMMEVVCGTRKNYEVNIDAPIHRRPNASMAER